MHAQSEETRGKRTETLISTWNSQEIQLKDDIYSGFVFSNSDCNKVQYFECQK